MSHHRLEFDEECEPCNGTGLYVGFAERDGSAVVCYRCSGTGCHRRVIKYTDFDGRKLRKNIKRVFEVNPGIGISEGDGYTLESFGGLSYDDWKSGKPFLPGSDMRLYTCPAWWFQTTNYKRKPDWEECICVGAFNNCPRFINKGQCWEKWDTVDKEGDSNGQS